MTDRLPATDPADPAHDLLGSDERLIRFAIFREADTQLATLVLASNGGRIRCELFGDGPDAMFVRKCLEEFGQPIAAEAVADRLDLLTASIRLKLKVQSFKMELLPEGDLQVDFIYDIRSGQTFGKHKALHAFIQADDKLGRNIQKAIRTAFDRPATEQIAAIRASLDNGDHRNAARIAIELEAELFFISRSRALLDAINAIDRNALPADQALEVGRIIVSLASAQQREDVAGPAAEQLLENDTTLDGQARFGLRNLLAVAALKRRETETGLAILRELLNEAEEIGAEQRGWIWRNFSMALDPDDPEARRAAKHAIDAFLEAGEKGEAARSIAQLSALQERNEPADAIGQFDQMLHIMSMEGILNEEIRANIQHAKGRRLLEVRNPKAALEAARKAVELRRGILGAEEQLISSLHLVSIAADNLGDTEVAGAADAEAKQLETEIGSEHFALARRVEALLQGWDPSEAASLLSVAEAVDDIEIYASIQVAVAIQDPSLTATQRLSRLEAALGALERRHARPDVKHPCRLAIAQILKEQGKYDRAADWYRKIVDDKPLDVQARDLLVDAYWRADKWGDAAIVLKHDLDAFGERPGVSYAYGRSLFEAGQHSEAVLVFTRALKLAEGKPDLQETIRDFRERALSLGGTISPLPAVAAPDVPITLDELRAALKEFAAFVSAFKRMDFWEKPDGAKKHKWRKRPERHGQTLLHTYLKASFKERIEIFEEIGTGAGRLDLLVRFAGGVSAIIELKMCGYGYSTEYARSGEDQIEHYMTNRRVHIGFLVTFDARQLGNGAQLLSEASDDQNTIEEITIDVRPTVKAG